MRSKIQKSNCPHCGYLLEVASPLENVKASPGTGDLTLCLRCLGWMMFDDSLALVALSKQQLVAMAGKDRKLKATLLRIETVGFSSGTRRTID